MRGNGTSSRAVDLGQLLEFGVHAEPLAAAVEGYAALGLREVAVADFVSGGYAAVSDGRVSIGLYDAELDGLIPTFVRPGLSEHARALEAAGVELELAELGDDEFHRVGFRDPNGLAIRLVEARTFPPVEPSSTGISACGSFLELSIATHSVEESSAFWSSLGFALVGAGGTPYESARLAGHGLIVGLHETGGFRAALTFRAAQLDARLEYLKAKGFTARRGSPLASGGASSATLFPPGDARFFLLDAEADADPGSDAG